MGRSVLNTLEGDCPADIKVGEVGSWLELGNRKKRDSFPREAGVAEMLGKCVDRRERLDHLPTAGEYWSRTCIAPSSSEQGMREMIIDGTKSWTTN